MKIEEETKMKVDVWPEVEEQRKKKLNLNQLVSHFALHIRSQS